MNDVNSKQYTRRFRIIQEFEVSSEDHLINLEIQGDFSTESNKKIDAHLIKINLEWIDQQEEEATNEQ